MDKKAYYRDASVAAGYEAESFSAPAGRLTHEAELAVLRASFASGDRLLELACGTGRLLRALRQDGRSVAGVDQSPEMLRAGFPEGLVDLHVADVSSLPFPNASFDGAYSFRFTNHYADLRPLFKECRRVLRAGGRLVFDTMRWSPLLWDSPRWGGRNYPVGDRQVEAWLREAGHEVEKRGSLFPVGPYILGGLPLAAARPIMTLGSVLPHWTQAVGIWHARKPS